MYLLTIPLVDNKGKSKGRLSRFVDCGKSFLIPRIGEEIWIDTGEKIFIRSVSYDGPKLQSIHVTTEPISDELKEYFLGISIGKNKQKWRWSDYE